ncbi:MAG: alanine--tRNA ligase, partial [Bacteroidetes bacterium]|nr:alanine--tRNA ligase [Bacteroidota bacterium]
IHVDIRDDEERNRIDGRTLVNGDHPQVIEIWNNVFMEFNRKADGSLEKLPAQHVDTGMGFERLCMVVQGKKSNYDTDIFQDYIQYLALKSGVAYTSGDGKTDVAMRVISDHIRAISFAIADGQLPSNTGAGYVIRRILRRAVRYGYSFLNFKEPFLYELVEILAQKMGVTFPELIKQKGLVQRVIQEEEVSFFRTLDKGIQRFNDYLTSSPNKIEGKFTFELYDTFGFPVDLTQLLAREAGIPVDMDGFNAALTQQKERSRAATTIDTEDWVDINKYAETTFVGYDIFEAEAELIRYRKVKTKGKEFYQLALSVTPFYAEGGGQVGDTGVLVDSTGKEIKVIDTKKETGAIIHITEDLPSDVTGVLLAKVDLHKRLLTQNNHSATHLLHAALRQVLGTHVEQKGSLVNETQLRFDFSHFAKVTDEEISEIEAIVNRKIREDIPLDAKLMPIEEAKTMGAMALFGEKYGDTVRVVAFDPLYSIELCGGTHVRSTGQIGFVKITSECAVASGIRRIEAVTAEKAEEFVNSHLATLNELQEYLKTQDLKKAIEQLFEQNAQLTAQVDTLIKEKSKVVKADLKEKVKNISGINTIIEIIPMDVPDAIKDIAFQLKSEIDNLFLVFGAVIKGKPLLTIIISENLVKEKNLNAGQIIRELAKEIQGGGGGQPFYATAGGNNPTGLAKALEKAKEFIK